MLKFMLLTIYLRNKEKKNSILRKCLNEMRRNEIVRLQQHIAFTQQHDINHDS